MSEKLRPRGRLFENKEKRKPSQPDMQGDGRIGGQPYAITAWVREDHLVLSWAPPRGRDSNSYPPEEFRGSLEVGDGADDAVWSGSITGDKGTFEVRAFERQGKSGSYLDLKMEEAPHEAPEPSSDPLPALPTDA